MREAYSANPDGWGILCTYDDQIISQKNITDFEEFWKHYVFTIGEQHIVHFRTASSGKISQGRCHPFYVNENLAFVQNGNLFHYSNYFWNDDRTDTQRFNEDVLKKLHPEFLSIPEIRLALEKYNKDNFSRMIFMDLVGRVNIVNEEAGEWIDGCWYSNGGIKNYIGYGYSGAYPISQGETRHKGGMISPKLFPKSRRKNWKKCGQCSGYFYKLDNGVCSSCQILNDLKGFCE